MKFSILIPVYNVERYLSQCLDSVLAQTFFDFEIILVNDGSQDNSPEICEQYVKKDIRIKYYSKKNEGLLLTRRFSLKHASGEYILFLDSDDYWDSNLLSTINATIENHPGVDMVLYRYRRVSDLGIVKYEDVGLFPDNYIFDIHNKNEFLLKFVASSRLNALWCKCVKRSIIDIEADYTMFKDKKGEDLLQSITLIKNANTILYRDISLMSYRLSKTGRGRVLKINYLMDYNIVRLHVKNIMDKMNITNEVRNIFFKRYLNGLIDMLISIKPPVNEDSQYIEILNNIKDSDLFNNTNNNKEIIDSLNPIRRIILQLLKHNTKILVYFIAILRPFKRFV